jgi:thiol-disulfide isomerase/thioredoxin
MTVFKLTLIALTAFSINCAAQDSSSSQSIRIDFDSGYSSGEGKKKDLFSYLVPVLVNNDSIQFGQDKYKVILPIEVDRENVAVAGSDFNSQKENIESRTIPYLINNFRSKEIEIFVDTTYSYDFRESMKYTFPAEDSLVIVTHLNSMNKGCKFLIDYRRARFKSIDFKNKISPYFSNSGPLPSSNESIDSDYWLEARRMNCRYSKFTFRGIVYKIGIYDYNCNGKYNDGDDRILFHAGEEPLEPELSLDGYEYIDNLIIGDSSQAFKVTHLEECGESIIIEPVSENINRLGLRLGQSIYEMDTLQNVERSISISHLMDTSKYTLIDVWASWCKPCLKSFPDLIDFYTANSDRVKMIGLNAGDSDSEIEEIEIKYGLKWMSWKSSKSIIEQLNIESYPTYMLFDHRGILVLKSSFLDDITDFMNKL